MDQDQLSPRKEKEASRKQEKPLTSSSNVTSTGIVQQSEGHGGKLASSSIFSRSTGHPMSRLSQEGRSDGGSSRPSGHHGGSVLGLDDGQGQLGSIDTSRQQVKLPCLPPKERPSKSPPLSPPKTGTLSSDVTIADSAQPVSRGPSIGKTKIQRNDQHDLSGALASLKERKRFHARPSLANVEEVGNATNSKKTRLGWGEGLANYENHLKEKKPFKFPAVGANGDFSTNNTDMTESVVCSAAVSADLTQGANGDGDNGVTSMTVEAKENLEDSFRSRAKTVSYPADVPALSHGCSPARDSSFSTSTKVQDILHCSNKIHRSSARMAAIIVQKLQVPRKFSRQNTLEQEGQTFELEGSRFNRCSQEERKAIFSEMEIQKTDIVPSPNKNNRNANSGVAPDAEKVAPAKPSVVKMDMDLNIPLHAVDVYSHAGPSVESDTDYGLASMHVSRPRHTTHQFDLNIPYSAKAAEDEVNISERLALDSGASNEMAEYVTHAQKIQSQMTIPETTKDLANRPGCVILFGNVIYQAPSSDTAFTSKQENVDKVSRG
ncbi:hypothetical protein ACP70R_009385 [Stipagrostis hirtigluma subsp. patula]